VSDRREWLGTLIRVALGVIFIWASWHKLADPYSNVQAVKAYELLPAPWFRIVGYTLPIVEVLIGVCLITGVITRVTAVFAALSMAVFIFGIISVWVRDININCGCFGDGGYDPNAQDKYPWEVARDSLFFLMAAYLVVWPRTKLAVDNLLFPRRDERILDGEEVH